MSDHDKRNKSKKVLADHKRRGKVFVPPFVEKIGPLEEISWVNQMLPELLWIGMIQARVGLADGVRTCEALQRAACRALGTATPTFLGFVSSFGALTDKQYAELITQLESESRLELIRQSLAAIATHYPTFPMLRLYGSGGPQEYAEYADITGLKSTLESLFDREGSPATFTNATFIYLAFVADTLKVAPWTSLANFPEIEQYPNTTLSRQIGSSIRASARVFFGGPHYPSDATWPDDFWNHGFRLEVCSFAVEDEP